MLLRESYAFPYDDSAVLSEISTDCNILRRRFETVDIDIREKVFFAYSAKSRKA
jgi:hypothetical protein